MTISIASAFKTPDGKTFDTRKEAEAHQSKLTRVKKLAALFGDDDVVTIIDIADNAEAVIAALSNPLGKGRKSKTPAA